MRIKHVIIKALRTWPRRLVSFCSRGTLMAHVRCVPNGIYCPPKGTSEWKQSWLPWSVVPNRSAQNWPLQSALRNEGFLRVQLMDTSGPHDPLHKCFAWWRRLRVGTGWWRRRALQETVVWSPTPFNPSKLSLRRVNTLKGLGHRDEPFRMEIRGDRKAAAAPIKVGQMF